MKGQKELGGGQKWSVKQTPWPGKLSTEPLAATYSCSTELKP